MTRLLLDTQIIIWLEHEPDKISDRIRAAITTAPVVYVSIASIWEISIKLKTGKLEIKRDLPLFANAFLEDYDARLLDIEPAHVYTTQTLPLHHRDPFDRILAAQAITENLSLVSSDAIFDQYIATRLW